MTEENLSRLLGIDYGLKRIGLALSDPLLIFAYAFKTIPNDNKLWQSLAQIVKEQNIKKIILGEPLNDKGEVNYFHKQWLEFKNRLDKEFHLEIVLWDERYSSVLAKEQIISSVVKKSKRRDKGLLDQNSAAIILQEYLNTPAAKDK